MINNGVFFAACARIVSEKLPASEQEVERLKEQILAVIRQLGMPPDMIPLDLVALALITQRFLTLSDHGLVQRSLDVAMRICSALHTAFLPPLSPDRQLLLDRMKSGEAKVIVCMECKQGGGLQIPSTQLHCVLCGETVWVATANIDTIGRDQLQPVCTGCFSTRISHLVDQAVGLVNGQAMRPRDAAAAVAAILENQAGMPRKGNA